MEDNRHFQEAIAAMLDAESQRDPLFAASYLKQGKTIEECCDYIISQVEKSKRRGFSDDEILNIAKHYYDEDDIKDVKSIPCRIVVNSAIELTEEEKRMAREKAMAQLMNEERERLQKKSKKPAGKVMEAQTSLF